MGKLNTSGPKSTVRSNFSGMRTLLLTAFMVFSIAPALAAAEMDPVSELVERIHSGASKKFIFELADQQSEEDYFELDNKGGKILIRGNNYISIAAGLNWYLKYHAGIHITWNNPRNNLNIKMPPVKHPERRSTDLLLRYYLNYGAFSYSAAFWDWERWQQEIDWMALHGITMPLALTGTATVWRNSLKQLGYSEEDIAGFLPGPAFQGDWMRGWGEGIGGPALYAWCDAQVDIQRKILDSYRRWGIEPVLAGFSGMMPSDAEKLAKQRNEKSGSYHRMPFLDPLDPKFKEVAAVYYKESEKLFGKANYYIIDPESFDIEDTKVFLRTIKEINPLAKLVIPGKCLELQAFSKEFLSPGDVIFLEDYTADTRDQEIKKLWETNVQNWIFCVDGVPLGRTGMFGSIQAVIDNYYQVRSESAGANMTGLGAKTETVGYNPVMYELLYELPWRKEKPAKEEWIENWPKAHYGNSTQEVVDAWKILAGTVYDMPWDTRYYSEMPVVCRVPGLKNYSYPKDQYESNKKSDYFLQLREALGNLVKVAERYRGCGNFEFDITDIARQALSGYMEHLLDDIESAYDRKDMDRFKELSDRFLVTIKLEDALLSSRREFMVGPWIEDAMRQGRYGSERDYFRWNARMSITTRSEGKTLPDKTTHSDIAHREWSGLLNDYYYPRWKSYFDNIISGKIVPGDAYDDTILHYRDIENAWVASTQPYPISPVMDPIKMAREVYQLLLQK